MVSSFRGSSSSSSMQQRRGADRAVYHCFDCWFDSSFRYDLNDAV